MNNNTFGTRVSRRSVVAMFLVLPVTALAADVKAVYVSSCSTAEKNKDATIKKFCEDSSHACGSTGGTFSIFGGYVTISGTNYPYCIVKQVYFNNETTARTALICTSDGSACPNFNKACTGSAHSGETLNMYLTGPTSYATFVSVYTTTSYHGKSLFTISNAAQAECCKTCDNTTWTDVSGATYQQYAYNQCNASGSCVADSYSYRCKKNYYGTSQSCTACPSSNGVAGVTASAGTTSAASCYIPSGKTNSDTTGSFTYTTNCSLCPDDEPYYCSNGDGEYICSANPCE